ncbi:uncharacterized protein ASPGLDRAFT_40245 [Aspergillus glaucus CBS 516.65]|uniref:NADH:flavin oxidoreductase/NADH oxidase N-terminal domain-containing protein n=1 Tax=Aspergillus glaucus CBS 516.65 TaxID=1160497 RepID=A0A1L9V5C1_ASPGL|nr:hypothetical protein ASPGLDRAFT_40245 [Aspergillus glaucus CBS 516.65]OJJ79124.1 hypothetical protein ASPGLDRAFT_40245 [Aspergillus glaucus CBS 516.65]
MGPTQFAVLSNVILVCEPDKCPIASGIDLHDARGFIFCQLWALGHAADPQILAKDGHQVISSGSLPMKESSSVPKPLTGDKILDWINDYFHAKKDAITVGFTGVEIHGVISYLCDQFLQVTCNTQEDRWAAASRIGTGYRISPWSTFQGMRMEDLHPQFTHLTRGLRRLNLAYLHVVDPQTSGSTTVEVAGEDNTFLFDAFGNTGRYPGRRLSRARNSRYQ